MDQIWDDIERVAGAVAIGPEVVRVYQDGLPVCGHEQAIVAELAQAGSRNHLLLLSLQARGAILMGTESPELLIEEHQLATAAFGPGRKPPDAEPSGHAGDTLLERRDRYIAERINATLSPGETGVLFIGMLHKVAQYLDRGIVVVHPLPARL